MYKIILAKDLELRPNGTVKFEGAAHGSGACFFHVKADPGKGATLHKHPYPETWIVLQGAVRFTVGSEQVEAGPGQIVVAEANVPHKYHNIGTDRLEIMCIHPSPNILQEEIEE